MTPSEAFLAWIDGKRVQVELREDWWDVRRFWLDEFSGLTVLFHTGISEARGTARGLKFRLHQHQTAPTEPKPINTNPDLAIGYRAGQEDSEAWGLLADLVGAFTWHKHLNQSQVFFLMGARDALKKRGMV